MWHSQLTPQFVEVMPDVLQEGVLYVSMVYALATHRCACGCGEEVVTPLSPADWQLSFDGEHISLKPSIGNWNLACRSHYWIKGNKVRWAADMSVGRIEAGREEDRRAKALYYRTVQFIPSIDRENESIPLCNLWERLRKRLSLLI
jgi:hypothetical protein